MVGAERDSEVKGGLWFGPAREPVRPYCPGGEDDGFLTGIPGPCPAPPPHKGTLSSSEAPHPAAQSGSQHPKPTSGLMCPC